MIIYNNLVRNDIFSVCHYAMQIVYVEIARARWLCLPIWSEQRAIGRWRSISHGQVMKTNLTIDNKPSMWTIISTAVAAAACHTGTAIRHRRMEVINRDTRALRDWNARKRRLQNKGPILGSTAIDANLLNLFPLIWCRDLSFAQLAWHCHWKSMDTELLETRLCVCVRKCAFLWGPCILFAILLYVLLFSNSMGLLHSVPYIHCCNEQYREKKRSYLETSSRLGRWFRDANAAIIWWYAIGTVGAAA